MREVFADSFYWIALANPTGQWHQTSKDFSKSAYLQKLSNKIVCQITDKNMSDNTCQCSIPPPVD
jgi:hypothetical protein